MKTAAAERGGPGLFVILTALSLCMAATGVVRADLGELWPAPPLTDLSPQDLEPAIEWKEDWVKTYRHHDALWDKQLASVKDEDQRTRQKRARMIALLRASIERFPQEDARRRRARFTIAEHWGRIGARTREMIELKSIIDDHPGDFEVALEALRRMLGASRDDTLQQRGLWMQYAVQRLGALGDGGYLLANDERITQAYLYLSELRRNQDRFAEAGWALRELEARQGRTYGLLREEVDLLLAAGRRDLAARVFEELRPLIPAGKSGDDLRKNLEKRLRLDLPQPAAMLTDVVLEGRYEVLVKGGEHADAATLRAVLENPRAAQGLVTLGPGRLASAWYATVDQVSRHAPATIEALAALQADSAAAAAAAAGEDDAALLAALRRYPWSSAVHQAMLMAGERALWRGESDVAYGWFEDVAALALDAAVRDRARVGAWLTLAQMGEEQTLGQTLSRQLESDRLYPWIDGSEIAGSELQRVLESTARQAAARSAGGWQTKWLTIPAVQRWTPTIGGSVRVPYRDRAPSVAPRPVVDESGMVFVTGLTFAAGYLPGESTPLWTRTAPLPGPPREDAYVQYSPAPVGGSAAGGRVFTRWQPDPLGLATTVVAFDSRSGDLLWSAAANPQWGSLTPVGDPVVVGGRVIVLGVSGELVSNAQVVCLDAATGKLLWRQSLGTQTSIEYSLNWRHRLDIAMFGNAVTVDRGSIYVSTNMGIVARLDPRDGAVYWISQYERSRVDDNGVPLMKRRGAAPAVVGEQVILLPRDRQGVVALDRRTGEMVWDRPFAPSVGLAGVAGGLVVVYNDHTLAGLDPATGRTMWRHAAPHAMTAAPQVSGDTLYVASPDQLLRIGVTNGQLIESRPLQHPIAGFTPGRDGLLCIAAAPAHLMPPEAGVSPRTNPSVRQGAAPPWGVRLHLDRTRAEVIRPPEGIWEASTILVRSGLLLEAVDLSRDEPILWRRTTATDDAKFAWSAAGGGMLLILEADDLQAVNLRDGATRWRTTLGAVATGLTADAQRVAVASLNWTNVPYLAMLDVRTGRIQWQREVGSGATATTMALRGDTLILGGIARWGNRSLRWLFDARTGERLSSDRPAGDLTHIERVRVMGDQLIIVNGGFNWGGAPLTSDQFKANPQLKVDKYSHIWLIDEGPGWVRVEDRGHKGRTLFAPLSHPTKIIDDSSRAGAVRGRWVVSPREEQVLVYEAGQTKPTATLTMPKPADKLRMLPLTAAVDPQGKQVLVVSRLGTPVQSKRTTWQVRLDLFDRASGKHLADQVLADVSVCNDDIRERTAGFLPADVDVMWLEGGIVLIGPNSVDVLGTANAAPDSQLTTAPALSSVTIDGDVSEWASVPVTTMLGPDGEGDIRFAFDGENRLLLTVSHPQRAAAPYCGDGAVGTGSRIEVAVTDSSRTMHFVLGLDADGRVVCRSLRPGPSTEPVNAAIRYDPSARRLTYEAAIPLTLDRNALTLGVAVAAWRGEMAGDQVGRYQFGQALIDTPIDSDRYRPVRLERGD